jgi:hypothetical protein
MSPKGALPLGPQCASSGPWISRGEQTFIEAKDAPSRRLWLNLKSVSPGHGAMFRSDHTPLDAVGAWRETFGDR